MLYVGNQDEQLLHDRAQKIRATLKDDAQTIIDSEASAEQQNEAAKQLLSRISEEDSGILEKSAEFISYRMERLVYKWFAAAYPKGQDERVMLRVLWFFREMRKLNHACLIEDFEWNNNRDEDDQSFDDFVWWEAIDAKIKAVYPQGVFTEKSFEEIERLHDEMVTPKIREYFEAHQEEQESLIRKIKEGKKSE